MQHSGDVAFEMLRNFHQFVLFSPEVYQHWFTQACSFCTKPFQSPTQYVLMQSGKLRCYHRSLRSISPVTDIDSSNSVPLHHRHIATDESASLSVACNTDRRCHDNECFMEVPFCLFLCYIELSHVPFNTDLPLWRQCIIFVPCSCIFSPFINKQNLSLNCVVYLRPLISFCLLTFTQCC